MVIPRKHLNDKYNKNTITNLAEKSTFKTLRVNEEAITNKYF